MKRNLHTLQDALAFQLQGLYYAEKKVKEYFEECFCQVPSARLKQEMKNYILGADNKSLKFERIFNYLMQEPETRKNKVIVKLLEETEALLFITDSPHLQDILMISCLQNINTYKISSLKTAYMFAAELELDTVSELLQQILEWELAMAKALSSLAIEEFNKSPELETA